MDYLATVRDSSTRKLVNGYWLVELYASVSRKNPVPVLPEPFSHEEPYSPGQNPIFLAAVHKIFELMGNSVATRDFFRDRRGYLNAVDFEVSARTRTIQFGLTDLSAEVLLFGLPHMLSKDSNILKILHLVTKRQ